MVTEQGRMKFTRPLYRDLGSWEKGIFKSIFLSLTFSARSRAIATFEKNRPSMHSTTAALVAKDLGLWIKKNILYFLHTQFKSSITVKHKRQRIRIDQNLEVFPVFRMSCSNKLYNMVNFTTFRVMAWQRYIDPPTGLLATGHVEMGAIYGHDGALWAASHGMDRVRYHELLELKNIFNNPKKGFSRG